jgi:hypothetical protein
MRPDVFTRAEVTGALTRLGLTERERVGVIADMERHRYVVPARYPLTVLHRPAADGTQTVWALPMAEDELWVPVERRAGDTPCRVCEGDGHAEAVQEALL